MISLFQEIRQIPEKKIDEENFFSICGFPHYERVASNILAFFFDNKREHRFNNLFINSLFSFVGGDAKELIDNVDLNYSVETETRTGKGNYIDISIIGDDYIIIIENKINASLYNDLEDYYLYAKKTSKTVFAFVLSLKENIKNNNNYIYITYEELLTKIKLDLGDYIINSNQKYLTYLLDFMDNMQNLRRGVYMEYDSDFINIIKNNENEVVKISKKLDELDTCFKNNINNMIIKLKDILSVKNIDIWNHKDSSDFLGRILVIDIYNNENNEFTIDAVLTINGWNFDLFNRKNKYNNNIEELLKSKGLKNIKNGFKYRLEDSYDLTVKDDVIINYISELINKLL